MAGKIFELSQQLTELNDRAYWLDKDDPEDALELEEINKSLKAIAKDADNLADWLATMIHIAQFAEAQADDLVKRFTKKKKAATNRLEFFKGLALSHMIAHNIRNTKGDLFSLSRSLSSGSVVVDGDFDAEKLPEGLYVVVPEVPEHKAPDIKALQTVLRDAIKDNKGKLDQLTQVVELDGLAGVRLVRAQSLKIK